jgi:hypothetical protein
MKYKIALLRVRSLTCFISQRVVYNCCITSNGEYQWQTTPVRLNQGLGLCPAPQITCLSHASASCRRTGLTLMRGAEMGRGKDVVAVKDSDIGHASFAPYGNSTFEEQLRCADSGLHLIIRHRFLDLGEPMIIGERLMEFTRKVPSGSRNVTPCDWWRAINRSFSSFSALARSARVATTQRSSSLHIETYRPLSRVCAESTPHVSAWILVTVQITQDR